MKNKLVGLIALVLVVSLFIPYTSADLITPRYKGISIENKLTNINDFQDYTFVSVGSLGSGMCPVKVIGDDGIIEQYYKFCSVSVYAINNGDFTYFELVDMYNETYYDNFLNDFFASDKAILVVDGLRTYDTVPVSSSIEKIERDYFIDVNTMKASLQGSNKERNNLVYVYIGMTILALLVIAYIFYKRRAQ